MLIGGLSEQEVQKIKRLLETENISYLIKTDTSILETNSESIQHNLRHLRRGFRSIFGRFVCSL